MRSILQFGIPTLDSLIGRTDVTPLGESDITDQAELLRLLEQCRIQSPSPASDPLSYLIAQHPALANALQHPGDVRRNGAAAPAVKAFVAAFNEHLGDKSLWERFSEQIDGGTGPAVTVESGGLARQGRHSRLMQHRSSLGEEPNDLPLRLGNRLSLDFFLGGAILPCRHETEGYGFHVPDGTGSGADEAVTSVCILGPDGTGKSILALHLASRYAADAAPDTCILYASTDLSCAMGQKQWQSFGLHFPNKRRIPFEDSNAYRSWQADADREIALIRHELGQPPEELQNSASHWLSQYILNERNTCGREVAFIDLEAATAGDDWGFLNRVLGSLPMPTATRHLLIIDAVEGLETLVGDKDSFGQNRSRRSRIAQVLRLARERCHILFVAEEPNEGSRLPEEFVADLVIRLRSNVTNDYSRRSVEIVKARAQEHTRGQHRIIIRGGGGSTTGQMENPDDPRNTTEDGKGVQGYFHVYQSLHNRTREVMKRAKPRSRPREDTPAEPAPPHEDPPAGFGIQGLDEMLGPSSAHTTGSTQTQYGLPPGRFTALIGDDGTHKSRLGRAFLSGCFLAEDAADQGVAILLTTNVVDPDDVAERMVRHWPESKRRDVDDDFPALLETLKERMVCRRLEVHEISSAAMMHIIECLVERAKHILSLSSPAPTPVPRGERHPLANRIRLVIDDWSVIRATYPAVAEDPLFLPFLRSYLEQEGVTTLVIDTQAGGPEYIIREEADQQLRALARHHIYTWNVPFFGEHRVAISTIPPIRDGLPTVVRELRPSGDENDDERLEVDPHFELLKGLEHGAPEPVALEVDLYAETEGMCRYVAQCNDLFNRLFTPIEGQTVVRGSAPDSYERMREFRYLQGDTRLGHTMVFQVDEFWTDSAQQNTEGVTLESAYLERVTVRENGRGDRLEDPYRVFQPSADEFPDINWQAMNAAGAAQVRSRLVGRQRSHYFDPVGYALSAPPEGTAPMDRIPFMWDFGFLLVRREPWEAVCREPRPEEGRGQRGHAMPVSEVWERLNKAEFVSWSDFFEACQFVARMQARHETEPVFAFDLDLLGPETLSCLALEVWASEIYQGMEPHSADVAAEMAKLFPSDRNAHRQVGLVDLLQNHREALYRTLLILGAVLPPNQFEVQGLESQSREAHHAAIAARHWYSTACDITRQVAPGDLVPLPLPGHYSVRGDWFLAVARGSRSTRLGFRAIDMLSTERANVARLQYGVGLPVRRISESTEDAQQRIQDHLRTRLWKISPDGAKSSLTYQELRRFGAPRNSPDGHPWFQWIWRSRLDDYDRHSRIWSKWLVRVLTHWGHWRDLDPPDYRNGLVFYRQHAASWPESEYRRRLPSYQMLDDHRKVLIAMLETATPLERKLERHE